MVAKWGNWHCGEDKARFNGAWKADVPTLFEDYMEGEAVRIVLVGERAWQVRMAGDGWLKSIHHPQAAFMPVNPDLLDDSGTRRPLRPRVRRGGLHRRKERGDNFRFLRYDMALRSGTRIRRGIWSRIQEIERMMKHSLT